jgi:DNA-binding LacI/PurR family transcriptional regulator
MSSVKEVAKQARVSVATVSRVINNDPVVSDKTRQKVLAVIKEMNYKPNLLAKNLRKQSSYTIIMAIPSITNPFYAEISKGAQEAVYGSGYQIVIGPTDSNKDQLKTYIQLLNTNLADGIIFVSTSVTEETLREMADKYPIVLCNAYYDGLALPCISIDNEKAGYDAARELLRRGLTNIAYITGTRDSSPVRGRLQGYRTALKEAGIDFRPELIVRARNDYGEVLQAINGITDAGFAVDGILAHSDIQAAYVLRGIKEGKLRLRTPPHLISFDGTMLTEITNPTISSIVQPMYDLGYLSVQRLLRKLKNEDADEEMMKIVPHQFVIRET